MNIAVIGTQAQFLTLLSYLNHSKIPYREVCLLFIIAHGGETEQVFKKLEEEDKRNWHSVYYFELWNKKDFLLKSFIKIKKYDRFVSSLFSTIKIAQIITAQYNTSYVKHLINITTYDEVVCLDEGTAVFSHIKQRLYGYKKKSRSWKEIITGLKLEEVESVTYFTKYIVNPLQQDKVIFTMKKFLKLQKELIKM